MTKATIKKKPLCPFCGQAVAKPRPQVERKLGEFSVGVCQCGAVYASDPTGHNIGSAMIEALVYACDDNWDLAWDLLPGDDYLTGRIEDYDEQTHQVVETRNLDGRLIRGIIYFVRLQSELAHLHPQGSDKKTPGAAVVEIEPERDPKRKRKRADKHLVKMLVEKKEIDSLVDLAFDDNRTLRFMQRLLYDPDEKKRLLTAHVLGQVCGRLSTRQPGSVSDLLHRMFEACADSAATNWGVVESIGAIIAARPDIFGSFTRYLLPYVNDPTTRISTLWAIGSIALHRPELIRNTSFYQLFPLLEHEDPAVRGHMLRLLGRIRAKEVISGIEKLTDDESELTVYEEGEPIATTVGQLAHEALAFIRQKEGEQP
jgi:hypothetical protein